VKKFCSYVSESMFKLSKLLISDIADSADENMMRCIFYEDCKVCNEDDEDNEDNEDDEEDSEDMNCKESSWEEDEEEEYWVKIYKI